MIDTMSKARKSILNTSEKDLTVLPDSAIDNGQERVLDCNDTGSEAMKRTLTKSAFHVRSQTKESVESLARITSFHYSTSLTENVQT